MKRMIFRGMLLTGLSAVTIASLSSCYSGYTLPDEYTVPVSSPSSGKKYTNTKNLKPTVTFPTRLAVVKVRSKYDGTLLMENAQQVERPEYRKQLSQLQGLAGVVNLNNVGSIHGKVDHEQLRRSARGLGANMLGIYRFNTSTHSKSGPSIVNAVTLGFAPANQQRSVSAVSLMLMDAKTGYVYGVLEESAEKSSLSSSWGRDSSEKHTSYRSKQQAMDKLMEKVPAFWNSIYQRHSR